MDYSKYLTNGSLSSDLYAKFKKWRSYGVSNFKDWKTGQGRILFPFFNVYLKFNNDSSIKNKNDRSFNCGLLDTDNLPKLPDNPD